MFCINPSAKAVKIVYDGPIFYRCTVCHNYQIDFQDVFYHVCVCFVCGCEGNIIWIYRKAD